MDRRCISWFVSMPEAFFVDRRCISWFVSMPEAVFVDGWWFSWRVSMPEAVFVDGRWFSWRVSIDARSGPGETNRPCAFGTPFDIKGLAAMAALKTL